MSSHAVTSWVVLTTDGLNSTTTEFTVTQCDFRQVCLFREGLVRLNAEYVIERSIVLTL